MPKTIAQPPLFADPSEPNVVAPRPDCIGQAKVYYRPAREILTKASGFMDAYDYTLNPYAGCFFGCTYCYAPFFSRTRQNRDAWGYWINVKENAVVLLKKRKPGFLDGKLIYMSSVTDPYQPIERELNLTRGLLEIMSESHAPKLVIQTRSPDVVRDCDLFRRIEDNGGRVQVNMTVTNSAMPIWRATSIPSKSCGIIYPNWEKAKKASPRPSSERPKPT